MSSRPEAPAGRGRHEAPPAAEDRRRKKKKKSAVGTLLLVFLMLVGAGVMAYPSISNWWNSMHASRAIAVYSQDVQAIDSAELEAMLSAAREYNRNLAEKDSQSLLTEEELAQYNGLLDPSGTGLMAYVTIPVLNETIPIYHGTDESVLQTAVGHLTWTSLPVGGEDTHSVLSGHRGLPRAKLFTDLDRLRVGDVFTVTVLDQTLAYEVDQILVVLPEETDELRILPGGDYCTLVTCTPYGINSHRLLVRGHRTEDKVLQPAGEDPVEAAEETAELSTLLKVTAVAVPALVGFLLAVFLLLCLKRRALRASVRRQSERRQQK